MRAITESNLLLGRVYAQPEVAAPPPAPLHLTNQGFADPRSAIVQSCSATREAAVSVEEPEDMDDFAQAANILTTAAYSDETVRMRLAECFLVVQPPEVIAELLAAQSPADCLRPLEEFLESARETGDDQNQA